MKKTTIDWRLLGGFGALLFFILIIGGLGILQIRALSRTVEALGRNYLPIQRSILEMKNSNGLYAMGIRNYVFWKSSRYLEAVSSAENLAKINKYSEKFDQSLKIYLDLSNTPRQRKWADNISVSQSRLRSIGEKIIDLGNKLGKTASISGKKNIKSEIDSYVMVFENTLYKINDFIDKTVEKNAMSDIKRQIQRAEMIQKQAMSVLGGSMIIILFIGGQTATIVYRDRKREKERREQLVQKMIRFEEEERRNLSLQIHDQMGQDLSALKIYMDLINNRIDHNDNESVRNISESKKILTKIMEKIHNISELLSPPELEEIGLGDTINALILQYKEITDIHFTYLRPDRRFNISKEHTLFLYRVVQEGLTNIVKHSKAKNVEIKFHEDGKNYNLIISDDGQGFSYKTFLKNRTKTGAHLGLLGLEERAELLRGKLNVESRLGGGTKLSVQIPIIRG